MSNYTLINIKGKKIKAFKTIDYILSSYYPKKIIAKKIKYRIKFNVNLYNFIPSIVKIEDKEFYKSDIKNINQKYFYLVEY